MHRAAVARSPDGARPWRAVATEIERKFLVNGAAWRVGTPRRLVQGYLNRDPARTVRIRIASDKGFLTIKGPTRGISRLEMEHEIALSEAEELLALCEGPPIEKFRYVVGHAGCDWEIDEFLGANAGLVIAEIELQSEEQEFARPPWLGREVTHDPRYSNSALVNHPFSRWGDALQQPAARVALWNLPRIGVGVIILRNGRILLGRRLNAHGHGTWALPGGKLEFGESILQCAIREVREETGLSIHAAIQGPYISSVFVEDAQHYVTLFVVAAGAAGEPALLEPHKCAGWEWFRWSELPLPLFAPLALLHATGFEPDATASTPIPLP